jgi:hypothetical protein
MKRSFEVWLETLKKHVNKIEDYEGLSYDAAKFIFENAMAHLVLGWAMVGERKQERTFEKQVLSSSYGKLGGQDAANKQAAERVANAETQLPWWKAGNRFDLFVEYVARLLIMSVKAPYETIFSKLASELGGATRSKKIWRMVGVRGHDGPHFAEAVAILVGSDLKNVDVRLNDLVPNVQHNLSVLLGNIEKRLRDVGFVPGTLFPPPDEVKPAKARLRDRGDGVLEPVVDRKVPSKKSSKKGGGR